MEVNSETSSRATALATFMARPKVARLFEFGKLSAQVGIAQVAVQAIGFVCGILVIRLLPTQEYALYTLANTMLGTMTILADGGIASGVLSQGGKVWQDKKQLGSVMATGLDLRRKFAIGSLIIAVPILFYLLQKHGSSWLVSALIVLSLMPAFFTSLSGRLLEIAPKLHQDISPLQGIQVISSAGRLCLTSIMVFVFPFAGVAILCSGIAQIWANWRLRKLSHRYTDRDCLPNPKVQKEMLGIVRRVMPGAAYYAISGQITVWLISIFGSTIAIAQLGALGRLSMILNFFTALLAMLIVPRFARMQSERKLLINRFVQIQGGVLFFCIATVSTVWLFPAEVLWILGSDYSKLTSEVILSISGACVGLMAGNTYSLSVARGWVLPPVINITLSVLIQITLILYLDLSSLMGVLKYGFLVQCSAFLVQLIYFLHCTTKVNLRQDQ